MASLKELLREMIYKINKTEKEKISSVNGVMPDETGNVEVDAIPIPKTASIGQTLAVKSVDENGKPIEWDAVDMSAGGHYIPSVTQTDENTMTVSFTASKDDMESISDQTITLPTGPKGDPGDPGANGITPHIGENGNWWIGDTDTGVKAEGEASDSGIHIGPNPPEDTSMVWINTGDDTGDILPPATEKYELPMAAAEVLGGVKADPAEETDTQPIRIGSDGKLYTAQGDDSGDEEWELIADVTVEEETQTVEFTWSGNPMRKAMVNISSLAADKDTNYMPFTFYTSDDANVNWRIARFYPEALPRKSALNRTYIGEVFSIGENPVMKFMEYYSGVHPISNKFIFPDLVRCGMTHGNGLYSDAIREQITGCKIHTYEVFAVGTQFKIWGVKK